MTRYGRLITFSAGDAARPPALDAQLYCCAGFSAVERAEGAPMLGGGSSCGFSCSAWLG